MDTGDVQWSYAETGRGGVGSHISWSSIFYHGGYRLGKGIS